MSMIRNFSSVEGPPPGRVIDSDAPAGMRQEILDAAFSIAERPEAPIGDERVYRIVCQSLGTQGAGQPYGGFRHAAGKELATVEWRRVYDLICRLWGEVARYHAGWETLFLFDVNRILSGYGIAWDLGDDGRLHRVLPEPAAAAVHAAMRELAHPSLIAASVLFQTAQEAFDDRPRRDRDACANAFDALEAVGKVIFGMPTATFGEVLTSARQLGSLNSQIIAILEAINTNRNRNYGHGVPFKFGPAEVDFTYLTCVSALLLLVRTRPGP